MAVTNDFEIEVNSILMTGATDSDYCVATWPAGLWRIAPKTSDLDLIGDGVYAGPVRRGPISLVWEVEMVHGTAATLQTNALALRTAWNGLDTEMHWQVAGTEYKVLGQPRRFELEEKERFFGIVVATVEFFVPSGADPVVVP